MAMIKKRNKHNSIMDSDKTSSESAVNHLQQKDNKARIFLNEKIEMQLRKIVLNISLKYLQRTREQHERR
jgi:tRNA uridine 5-carbamoylmethylation protein Kti12